MCNAYLVASVEQCKEERQADCLRFCPAENGAKQAGPALSQRLVSIFPDFTSVGRHHHAADFSGLSDPLPGAHREFAHSRIVKITAMREQPRATDADEQEAIRVTVRHRSAVHLREKFVECDVPDN